MLKRFFSSCVLVEHRNGKVAGETMNALAAAFALKKSVHCVVLGKNVGGVAESIGAVKGVESVFVGESDAFDYGIAETTADALVQLVKEKKFTHVLAPHSAFGKNIMPRVAALLDVMQVSDITKIISEDTFVRPIYAGNAIAKVKSKDAIKIITVRSTAFPAVTEKGSAAKQEPFKANVQALTRWVKEERTKSERPELGSAKVVIGGGRGLQNGENFKILYDLADKLGGTVGASRAAVDAGFVPNDLQIGQTGKIIAPEIYFAVGISGAIQHLAGMKDSKVIVAINKDADAPIFQVADYGLVQDLFQSVPELTKKL